MVNLQKAAEKELYGILSLAGRKLSFSEEDLNLLVSKFLVEVPADPSHGEFASNIAMVGAKILKMPPMKVAELICENIVLDGSYFKRFEFVKPGFLNFFLSDRWFSEVVKAVLQEKDDYGKSNFGCGKKVIVEFVSANPTGPMHVGNARGGALGDSLAEIFSFAGFSVYREFYVNDSGNQIEKFKKSLSLRYLQLYSDDENFSMPEDCYLGGDIVERAKEFARVHGRKFVEASESERGSALCNYALPKNINGLKEDLLAYRIEYDNWFFESELHLNGSVLKIVDMLKERGYVYEKNGAVWFNYSKLGGDKDEVLIRENKIPTYFAADIAYHYNKFVERGFFKAVDVWGADHHGHVERLKGALMALGVEKEKLDVVLMQMVRLVRGNEVVKASKRSGKAITLSSLLEDVSVDAARFFFNSREPNSHFDFDLDLALEQSQNNPVYYVQHAHARICSILNNLQDFLDDSLIDVHYEILKEKEEIELIKAVAIFPNEIVEAVKTDDPSRIAKYSVYVAAKFQKFYSSYRVKCSNENLLRARLGLCLTVKTVLKNSLQILKVEALKEF